MHVDCRQALLLLVPLRLYCRPHQLLVLVSTALLLLRRLLLTILPPRLGYAQVNLQEQLLVLLQQQQQLS